jgi:hypothetical protein
LKIADSEGDLEMEFPALESNQRVERFGFKFLGLVEVVSQASTYHVYM